MPSLQIQLMHGKTAGRNLAFEQERVTFGRAEDNDLVLADEHVSRHHGEIRYEGDRWVLYNLSRSGTKVRRARVGDKPRPLADGEVVSIGRQSAFRLRIAPAEGGRAAIAEDVPAEERRLSGRAKLWIGIGIYLVVSVGVIVVLATVVGRDSSGPVQLDPVFTVSQIQRDVTRKPRGREHPDPVRADAWRQRATEFFMQRQIAKANRFNAYRAYQQSLSWSDRDAFEDKADLLRFNDLETELIDLVIRYYEDGYAKLRAGQYREAAEAFRELIRYYPDHESPLFRNVERHRSTALSHLGRRR
ncbi:MAG: hypothetical protein CMJ18_27985 [Phycisphaeraceae bacterium]|nr:hypothetical protein [Phycisphaeraceae bacterium]